jgi:nitrogen fixation NifU-like protein
MSDLSALYHEVILDHARSPRNFGPLSHPTHRAAGETPLCGDRIEVTLAVDGDRAREVRFTGAACAIALASASLMTEAIADKTRGEAAEVTAALRDFLAQPGAAEASPVSPRDLGPLAALGGVRVYPVRVQCALLAWNTMWRAWNADQ